MLKKITVTSTFFILVLVGFFTYGGYGIGVDEPTNRQNGLISTNYIVSKVQAVSVVEVLSEDRELKSVKTTLEDYTDKDYGVLFDVPAFILERILKLDESYEQYKLRKILTYLIFIAGLFALYRMATVRFNHYYFGLLAVALMIFSPRIFGESFYNSKDIVFMALFTMAMHRMLVFVKMPTIINAIYFGLATAFAIDIRIIAIVLPLMTIGLMALKIASSNVKFKIIAPALVTYYVTCIAVVIFFWPWLWEDPIARFVEAFNNMSQFRLNRWELFNGKFHTTTNLPWYYLPTWILITTPITYIIFFIIGILALIGSFFKVENRYVLTDTKSQDLTYLVVFLGPVVAAAAMNSVMYNGWRHFYFIYPAIVLIIINGINVASRSTYFTRASKPLVICILIFTFLIMALNLINYYPLQYVYFNKFAGTNLEKKYPMDYASLSVIKGFEYLDQHEHKQLIKVSACGPLKITLPKTLLILPQNKKSRFQIVDDPNEADYIFCDYQFFSPLDSNIFYKNIGLYESIFDLRLGEGLLLSIFKER
jgi:hypothetical protein